MRNDVIIYGAGGHAKSLISLLRLLHIPIAGIVDDAAAVGTLVSGVPVLGNAALLPDLRGQDISRAVNAVGGIGHYEARKNIFHKLHAAGFEFPTVIHPAAFVEDTVTLADGVQVLAQSYISSESTVGFGTLINAGVVISHDGKIGEIVNLSPGALLAGNVTVGDYAQIGMGVTVNLGVTVGAKARVGNSAVVKGDVPEGTRVYAGMVWPPRNAQSLPKNLRKSA